jgi:hypothetical protein
MLKQDIKILSAEDLQRMIDRKEQVLELPDGEGAVKLRALTLSQRDAMIEKVTDNGRIDGKVDPQKILRQLVLTGVVEPMFTEELIDLLPAHVVDYIAQAVMALNGMDKAAALSASVTFRSKSRAAVPVPAGEGSGVNGSGPPS